MSNIANTIKYLKAKDNRYITITVQETNIKIGKDNVYLSDIPGEDLEQYIKTELGPINKPTLVWVELRTKQGPTSKKDHACAIEISPTNYLPDTQPVSIMPIPVPNYPKINQVENTPSFLAQPSAGNTNLFGLGLAEVVSMQVKADRLSHKEEQLVELKDEYRELKHRYNMLDIEHRSALGRIATADAQKEMAVMLAKSENKSVFESVAFEKLMEKAPELLGSIAAMKGGVTPNQPGALGMTMPDTHREFVEHVVENLNENQINLLGSICHFIDNEGFNSQLSMLIKQYSNISNAHA